MQRTVIVNQPFYRGANVFSLAIHILCLKNMYIFGFGSILRLVWEIPHYPAAQISEVIARKPVAALAECGLIVLVEFAANVLYPAASAVYSLKQRELACAFVVRSQGYADIIRT